MESLKGRVEDFLGQEYKRLLLPATHYSSL